jgi:hypothetical protein
LESAKPPTMVLECDCDPFEFDTAKYEPIGMALE